VKLDSELNAREFMSSMKCSLFFLLTLCTANVVSAQITAPSVPRQGGVTTDASLAVPAATMASVQKAVQTLGDNALRGKFSYAFDNMYPRYKKKQEKLLGKKIDSLALESQMAARLNKMGVTITSYTAGKPVGVFKVWKQIKPALKMKIDQGIKVNLKNSDVFHNWMFIVPTTQVWTFMSQKGGLPRKALINDFQIVVAQEQGAPGQEKWTFIDGLGMTTRELRSIFPSLPAHLTLPTPSKSEIK